MIYFHSSVDYDLSGLVGFMKSSLLEHHIVNFCGQGSSWFSDFRVSEFLFRSFLVVNLFCLFVELS